MSDLLNMSVEHFEPAKVIRYRPGERFGLHHDAMASSYEEGCSDCPTPYANRIVTLFVYLNEVASGGSTRFEQLRLHDGRVLKIRPRQGMACVHFPAYLPSALDETLRGRRDERVAHEGLPAVGEKLLLTQWCWTGPLLRDVMDERYKPSCD
eukprot:SRR837773.14027.p2 GENE.SRR837773.14027~~SRR837773.14027.p2  ORF type:complete len:165 (+),score=23.95 SRR837773.14027:40-495(+)